MSSETDALIELLIQLKRIVGTVPDQAKALLTSQPQLAYSLIQLMVKMNILSPEVLQKTLSSLTGPHLQPPAPARPTPPPVLVQHHALPGLSNGHPQTIPGFQHYPPPTQQSTPQPPPQQPQPPTSTYTNLPPATPHLPATAQAMLAAIPEDQKNMIMQILSYTPEQINQLAPTDRATFVQLRATFGIGS